MGQSVQLNACFVWVHTSESNSFYCTISWPVGGTVHYITHHIAVLPCLVNNLDAIGLVLFHFMQPLSMFLLGP